MHHFLMYYLFAGFLLLLLWNPVLRPVAYQYASGFFFAIIALPSYLCATASVRSIIEPGTGAADIRISAPSLLARRGALSPD